MSKVNLRLGERGEQDAIRSLKASGYKILTRNYKARFGEVDIIAEDEGTLCFIEVKSRVSDRFGLPEEAVSARKQRQIAKASLAYLKENKLFERSARFDVVALDYSQYPPAIKIIKNAFDLDERYSP